MKAKKKGTATVWVYAQNGMFAAVSVTVKQLPVPAANEKITKGIPVCLL